MHSLAESFKLGIHLDILCSFIPFGARAARTWLSEKSRRAALKPCLLHLLLSSNRSHTRGALLSSGDELTP